MNGHLYHITLQNILLIAILGCLSISPASEILYTERLHLTSQDYDLCDNKIHFIRQDSLGFMWFCTSQGLDRYDGYTFKHYTFPDGIHNNLPGNNITSIYLDKNEIIWIATQKSGFARLDSKTDSVQCFLYNQDSTKNLKYFFVCDIIADDSGLVWAATRWTGIQKYDPLTGIYTSYQHDPQDPSSLSSQHINKIYQDRTGNLWVGSSDNGLDLFDRGKNNFRHFTHTPNISTSLSNNCVQYFYEDRKGNLWIGTNHGLNKYNPQNETFTRFEYDPQDVYSINENKVFAISEDRQGNLLVGTVNGGLNVYDPQTNRFYNIRNSSSFPPQMPLKIRSICVDRSNCIWLGSIRNGVYMYSQSTRFARHIRLPEKSVAKKTIVTLYAGSENVLLIGTNEGLEFYDMIKNVICSPDPKYSDLSKYVIFDIKPDLNDNLWLATSSGLKKIPASSRKIIHYDPDPNDNNSLSDKKILSLLCDRSGVIWAGTSNGYLEEYSAIDDAFIHHKQALTPPVSIQNITEDTEGNIWFGTYGHGLKKLNRNTNLIEDYDFDPRIPGTFSSSRIASLACDSGGSLWIGTGHSGVFRYHPATGTYTTFTQSDGLINNDILSLIIDDRNSLWIQTITGLSRYSIPTGSISNLDIMDGIDYYYPPEQMYISQIACSYKDQSGRLYFAGINGISTFHPDSLEKEHKPPNLILTQIEVFGKVKKLPLAPEYTETIRLDYDENFVTFRFALLDYVDVNNNQFFYRLKRLESEWVQAGVRNYASYANLKPGTYTFEVKGVNKRGVWTKDNLSIDLIIVPPFWQTWYFRLGSGLFLVGLVAMIVLIRLRAARRYREKLEELVEEKSIELHQKELKYRSLFEEAIDLIFTANLDGRILDVNRHLENVTGYHKTELIGKNLLDIVDASLCEAVTQQHQKVIDGAIVEYETKILNKSGESRDIWFKIRPITQNDKVVEIHGTGRDITALKEAEANLRNAEKAKRESLKQLSLKLAHEIKNPLATIKSSAQLVAGAAANDDNRLLVHMERINRNVNICNKVIRELYDFTQEHYYELTPISTRLLTDKIYADALEIATEYALIEIFLEAADTEVRIAADEFKLSQAFKNVLRNAFEAMPNDGTLTISTKIIDPGSEFRIEISDTGIGISKENQKNIFQPFYSTKATGFGFGLPLVYEIITAHRGRIEFQSTPDFGTRFQIFLPILSAPMNN